MLRPAQVLSPRLDPIYCINHRGGRLHMGTVSYFKFSDIFSYHEAAVRKKGLPGPYADRFHVRFSADKGGNQQLFSW